jgi:hypothetical protein
MKETTSIKCAHPACICTVAKGETFCSQYCSDAGKEDVEISCDCGHEGCAIAENAPTGEAQSRMAG